MSDVLQQVVMALSIAGFSAICGFGGYLGYAAAKIFCDFGRAVRNDFRW